MDQSVKFHFVKKRKSLVSLTAAEKLRILDELDVDCNTMRVAEKYGVDSSTLRKWKKNRAKIEATYEISAESKRCKWSPNKSINDAVFLWFQKMRNRGIIVSGTIIKEKAILFHKKIGGTQNFVASTGWLDWWKKKYNIRQLRSRVSPDTNSELAIKVNDDQILSEEKLENIIVEQVLEDARNYGNFVRDPMSMESYKKSPDVNTWTSDYNKNNYSKSDEFQESKTIEVWLNENRCKVEREDLEDEHSPVEDEQHVTISEALQGLEKLVTYCQQNNVLREEEATSFRSLRLMLESRVN